MDKVTSYEKAALIALVGGLGGASLSRLGTTARVAFAGLTALAALELAFCAGMRYAPVKVAAPIPTVERVEGDPQEIGSRSPIISGAGCMVFNCQDEKTIVVRKQANVWQSEIETEVTTTVKLDGNQVLDIIAGISEHAQL